MIGSLEASLFLERPLRIRSRKRGTRSSLGLLFTRFTRSTLPLYLFLRANVLYIVPTLYFPNIPTPSFPLCDSKFAVYQSIV